MFVVREIPKRITVKIDGSEVPERVKSEIDSIRQSDCFLEHLSVEVDGHLIEVERRHGGHPFLDVYRIEEIPGKEVARFENIDDAVDFLRENYNRPHMMSGGKGYVYDLASDEVRRAEDAGDHCKPLVFRTNVGVVVYNDDGLGDIDAHGS